MLTSYNGWPASKDPKIIGINTTWAPLGVRFPNGVKSGAVEAVFTWLVTQLHTRVEPIDLPGVNDEWGYFYKPSANSPLLLSCHSSGTAIDYNATRHPNGKRGTWNARQVAEIRKIVSEAGVIRWLGDATGTPDEMHFEIKGSPAQVAAAAARLTKPQLPPQEDDMAEAKELVAVVAAAEAMRATLGREPDSEGLQYWAKVFADAPLGAAFDALQKAAQG